MTLSEKFLLKQQLIYNVSCTCEMNKAEWISGKGVVCIKISISIILHIVSNKNCSQKIHLK